MMILNRIQAGELSAAEAALLMQVSERHVRRLLATYREEGAAAIAHGNRGRQPAHTIAQEIRDRVLISNPFR